MFHEHRDVYLFYNEQGNTLKNEQIAALNRNQKGVQERDIALHSIDVRSNAPEIKKWHIDTAASFTFLLIGKDGGEKLRSATLVTAEKLFAIIDAMPMRKAEMKKE